MRKVDLNTLHIRNYSDTAFATNLGHTSQLGWFIMLCDEDENTCILQYASYKS